MLFKIKKDMISVDVSAYNNKDLFTGYLSENEFLMNTEKFSFSHDIMLQLHNKKIQSKLSKIDAYPENYIGELVILNDEKTAYNQSVLFLIKKNLFLIISNNLKIHEQFKTLLHEHDITSYTLEKIIFLFFDSQIQRDTSILDAIQDKLSNIDELVFKNKPISFTTLIDTPRKQIRMLDHTYDHLLEIGEELVDNELDFFDKDTRFFKILKDRILRLHNSTQMLDEFMNTIRDSYQYNTDNDLNTTMKLLTVITAIFQPLTLIVGWYGMNFTHMPELSWKYGYFFVIILSILSIVLCYYIFKKKKMF